MVEGEITDVIRSPGPRSCVAATGLWLVACGPQQRDDGTARALLPLAIIDLGAVVTEDLPERMWGNAFLDQMGFTEPHSFDVIRWTFPVDEEEIKGSNAYYTLFNHGGPHVDAPNHVGGGGGLDTYPVDAFAGPLRVFDVRGSEPGRTIPRSVFDGRVESGDVVLTLTGYEPPGSDDEVPSVVTLSSEAAQYLAQLPVRAYGTDSFSVEALDDTRMPSIRHVFLKRGIPVYEQLLDVEASLGRTELFFVGVPLNIQDGDGMIVRPVVLDY